MTVTPVVAPYAPSYANRTPYITVQDFLEAPTGTDTTQLLPGKPPEANILALAGVIERASAVADTFCQKVLAATTDVQSGRYRLFRDGTIRVPVDFTPVLYVTGVSTGWQPDSMQALTSLTGTWIDKKIIQIPILGYNSLYAPTVRARDYTQVYAQVTYVNGWFHTTTAKTGTLAKGATSFTPVSSVGAVPGLPFTIYDGANTEQVTVASNYAVGSAVITLASATTKDHQPGVTVSALPPDIRQAAISLTSALIKRRGGEAIVLASMHQQPTRKTLGEPGVSSDEQLAARLLKPYRRIM